MIDEFEKLFEPEYGEVAPEVTIPPVQDMDYENANMWRAKTLPDSIAEIHTRMKKCNCYEKLMEVPVVNTYMVRENNIIIPLRIYSPAQEGVFPILLFYHGGGFSMNNMDVYDYQCRYMARFGQAVVIACEYRLMPEDRFPAGLEDCYATLEWAVKHAERYQGDTSKIIVCGDSSGGNFAAAITQIARDRKGPEISKQILIYPLVTLQQNKRYRSEERYGKGYFLEYNSQKEPFKLYFRPEDEDKKTEPYCSPLLAKEMKGLPPALILAAECDPLLDQGLMYAKRLKDAGIKVEYHMYKGMIHGFFNYTYGKSFECLDEICRVMK